MMAYNVRTWARRGQALDGMETSADPIIRRRHDGMEKREGIRLSAMEIALLVVLLGSLALGLLQAWQQEQMERMLEAEHEQ